LVVGRCRRRASFLGGCSSFRDRPLFSRSIAVLAFRRFLRNGYVASPQKRQYFASLDANKRLTGIAARLQLKKNEDLAMPRNRSKPKMKLKTHRGAAKRFKITATGKLIRMHSGKRHLLGTKAPKRMRKLKKLTLVNKADKLKTMQMLPYGLR
jgi:large subunit ribosomal protein L35